MAVQSLFFTFFDDHKGQSLLWSRSKRQQNLDGVELQALPSGLHLVNRDTYYFRRTEPSSTTDSAEEKSQLGTVVFRNRELTPEEVERAGGEGKTRGRLMIGLGALSRIQDTNIHFTSLSPLEQAIDAISREWKVERSEEERQRWLDDMLDPVWETIIQDNSGAGEPETGDAQDRPELASALGVTPDNPIESLVLLSQTLGVSLLSLWKYAAAGRRILFYGSPPLTSICQAAYCTWLASLRLSELQQRPISTYLGMIGLTDMSAVASLPHGWVACTSDAIYKDKTGIFDLLVDCSGSDILPSEYDETVNPAREPVMRAVVREKGQVSLKYLTYTYSDTVFWNAIAPLLTAQSTDSQKSDLSHTSIWRSAKGTYTYICDICWGLCAFATGTAYSHSAGHADHARGYIRLPTDDQPATISDDGDSIEDDEGQGSADTSPESGDTRSLRAIQILKILDHRRDHIEQRLAQSVRDAGATSLSNEDMRKMGLSAWSWVDVEFVRGLHRLRRTEPVSTGTIGSGLEVEKRWFRKAMGLVGL